MGSKQLSSNWYKETTSKVKEEKNKSLICLDYKPKTQLRKNQESLDLHSWTPTIRGN